MNTIQKWFYRQTKEYKNKRAEDWTKLLETVEVLRKKVNGENSLKSYHENRTCPNCGEKDDKKIVNKIHHVHGSVRGRSWNGHGYTSGSTDTGPVNHCNTCGNQWKKSEVDWLSDDVGITDYIAEYFALNIYQKQNIGELLNPFYAENIYHMFRCNCSPYRSFPSLEWLRTKYKSIYDKD